MLYGGHLNALNSRQRLKQDAEGREREGERANPSLSLDRTGRKEKTHPASWKITFQDAD
jgi:hypothetical protein